jgi:hypothetical protein
LGELSADVEKARLNGGTALCYAAHEGHLDEMRWLVREFGANINYCHDGETALMEAARSKHAALTKWMVKAGADPQAKNADNETVADISQAVGASAEQTAYLEAKTHCANPGCGGAGTKKCQGCMQGRYCGPACYVAHWPAHKAECRRLGAALKSAQERAASESYETSFIIIGAQVEANFGSGRRFNGIGIFMLRCSIFYLQSI